MLEELLEGSTQLVVPALWQYEMANMLRSGQKRGLLSKASMRAALRALGQIPIHEVYVRKRSQSSRILEMALRFDLSAYDAAYLELSDRLKIPLLSTDKTLRKAYKALT